MEHVEKLRDTLATLQVAPAVTQGHAEGDDYGAKTGVATKRGAFREDALCAGLSSLLGSVKYFV